MTVARDYDVVIAGGGILGVSAAYWLAEKSDLRVALVERRQLAAGSTGKSAAIVRMHYTNAVTVQLALRSRQLFADWHGRVDTAMSEGVPPYHACGWVFLVPADQEPHFARNVEMNQAHGADVIRVDHRWLRHHLPGIAVDGVAAAAYEPASGYADPVAICQGLARAASARGVTIVEGRRVTEPIVENGTVVGVRTTPARGGEYEELRGEHTVVATGAWSGHLMRPLAVAVPLQVVREQEVVLETAGKVPTMAISNMCDQIYLRPANAGRILVGRGYPKEYEEVDPDSFDEKHDAAFSEDVIARLGNRFPSLGDPRVVTGVVGLYAVTPDWHPVVGPVDGVPGLWLAFGGSGHAFKIGPALGEMLADRIHRGACTWADATAFELRRFSSRDDGGAGPRPFVSSYGGNRA